jgi:mannitol-specific phosphotransferase system IIBC component
MKPIELIKKSVFNFAIGIASLSLIVSLLFNAMLLVKVDEDQQNIGILVSQAQADKAQIQNLTVVLHNANERVQKAESNLKQVQFKLDSALVPQSNVQEAFKENVAKPVTETSKGLWHLAVDNSKRAWNYVFH